MEKKYLRLKSDLLKNENFPKKKIVFDNDGLSEKIFCLPDDKNIVDALIVKYKAVALSCNEKGILEQKEMPKKKQKRKNTSSIVEIDDKEKELNNAYYEGSI